MKILPDITTKKVALHDLTFEDMAAIYSALLHEAIRAERRAGDERLGGAQRDAEMQLKAVVNRLAATLGIYQRLWS